MNTTLILNKRGGPEPSISYQLYAKNTETIVASGDKDLFQLVSNNVKQLDMKGKLYDSALVKEKMGVEPHQVSDLLALTGDSADNIPVIIGLIDIK